MDVQRRLEVVEQENLLLRERIASLEAILMEPASLPIEWGLTSQEARVFGVLVNREVASKEAIMVALYADRIAERDEVMPKIVDVFVCKIRRKLRPYGIEIVTRWGQGFTVDAATRARFRGHARRAA